MAELNKKIYESPQKNMHVEKFNEDGLRGGVTEGRPFYGIQCLS